MTHLSQDSKVPIDAGEHSTRLVGQIPVQNGVTSRSSTPETSAGQESERDVLPSMEATRRSQVNKDVDDRVPKIHRFCGSPRSAEAVQVLRAIRH